VELFGQIYDAVTRQPLPGASVTIPAKGLGVATDGNGYFDLNSALIAPSDKIVVTYVGYSPGADTAANLYSFNLIDEVPALYLQPAPVELPGVTTTAKKPSSLSLIIAGGLGLLLLADSGKKKKKIGSITTSDITPFLLIGGAILVYPLAKQLIDSLKGASQAVSTGLGLTDSEARQLEDATYATGNYPLFSNAFDRMVAAAPVGSPLMKVADLQPLISMLVLARGILFEDSQMAITVFHSFKTQLEVAWFAKNFQAANGSDLFTWMRKEDTLFSQGFASSTVATIITYINSLPLYNY
jgi:hypothetical protein